MGIVKVKKSRRTYTIKSKSSGKMTLRIKKPIKIFLGTDLVPDWFSKNELYGPYKKGDLISIPNKYGNIFLERGIAVKTKAKLPVKQKKAKEPVMILASILTKNKSISKSELVRKCKKKGLSKKQVNETLVSLKESGYVIESGKGKYVWDV